MDAQTKRERNYIIPPNRSIFPLDIIDRKPRAYRFCKTYKNVADYFFIAKYQKKTEKLKSINIYREQHINLAVTCSLKSISLHLKLLISLICYIIKFPEYVPVIAKNPVAVNTTNIYIAPDVCQALYCPWCLYMKGEIMDKQTNK